MESIEKDILFGERKKKELQRKKLNEFFDKNFVYFVILIIALILGLGFYFLIIPKYEEIKKMKASMESQKSFDFENKKKELERIRDLLDSYNKIDRQNIERIDAILPSKYQKEELFTIFNHLMEKNGLALVSFSIEGDDVFKPFNGGLNGKTADGKNSYKEIRRLNLRMSIRGVDYNALKNLLFVMEDSLQIMDINNLSFDPNSQGVDIAFQTYYLN